MVAKKKKTQKTGKPSMNRSPPAPKSTERTQNPGPASSGPALAGIGRTMKNIWHRTKEYFGSREAEA